MKNQLTELLRPLLEFERVVASETIQSLWSGYGELMRVRLSGYERRTVIVKHIQPPAKAKHPRKWATDIGHQRKLKSYQVEERWYSDYAHRLTDSCRIAKLIASGATTSGFVFVLEDLDAAGFPLRKSRLSRTELLPCLSWLAAFHAEFLNQSPDGLWEQGTYWQLETRPEEYEAMATGELKEAAQGLHDALNAAQFKTLVHGDAKYANFCFSEDGGVAVVDFQYVGGGCGIKDVAYLLSCVTGGPGMAEAELLDHYFAELRTGITAAHPTVDVAALEAEWRGLYSIAWADFERFLLGWAPGHWKSSVYSARQVQQALAQLSN